MGNIIGNIMGNVENIKENVENIKENVDNIKENKKYKYKELLENDEDEYHKRNFLSLDSYPIYNTEEIIQLCKEMGIEYNDVNGLWGLCKLNKIGIKTGMTTQVYELETSGNTCHIIQHGDVIIDIKLIDNIKHNGFKINFGSLFSGGEVECDSFDKIINIENIFPLIPLVFTSVIIEIMTDTPLTKPVKFAITYGYCFPRHYMACNITRWNNYYTYSGSLIKMDDIPRNYIYSRNPWKVKYDNIVSEIKYLYPITSMGFPGGQEYIKSKKSFDIHKNITY